MILRIGSRKSPLARIQVDEVYALLKEFRKDITFDSKFYDTAGDQDKNISLLTNTQDDIFTDQIDQALLNGTIDIAIHSAKDLPQKLADGLAIFALTKSVDATDAFVGKSHFAQLPFGSKIATSSPLRKESIKLLRPDLITVDIRGTIEERLWKIDEGYCDGVIVATAALKRLGLQDKIKDIMPWEGFPLQGQLAVVGRKDNIVLKDLFAPIDIRRNYGAVFLVGAGPGDPDLITIKGRKILEIADCVLYDFLISQDLLLYAPQAEKIYAGKRKGDHSMPQEELSKLIREKAMEGKTVVRLKGGDPLVFGRGADEIRYLRSYHIDVEVIPGVSSATSLPSRLGVPLTARDVSSSVAFVSAHGPDEGKELHPVKIPQTDTIVFLMGLSKIDSIVSQLKENGWKNDTPVLLISRGTTIYEKIIKSDLQSISRKIKEQEIPPPALIVVGDVVNFYDETNLKKEKVLFTGIDPKQYESLGSIVHFPMIDIKPVIFSPASQEDIFQKTKKCDCLLLTSRFGVEYFLKIIGGKKDLIELLNQKDIFVIGMSTAKALEKYNLKAKVIPLIESSEGLVDSLESYPFLGKIILFPRSSLPNPTLKRELEKRGAIVEEISVYQNTKPEKRELPKVDIDKVVFTSPSTVENFLKDFQAIPLHWKVICRGSLTQKKLKDAGYRSTVVIC